MAQTVADQEGPRVNIRAEATWVGESRRVRARFSLQDDAYVFVGQIDPDGVVRVVFPTDPKDDGFVRGGDHPYETDEVFAGFADQYRFRYQTARYLGSLNSPDSYDRGLGYMFVIASWRPLHFEQLSSGAGSWDSYEIADDQYLSNPRPAIYELASLLSGQNREAYTVQFASYYNTTTYGGTTSYSAFNSAFCPDAGLTGFGFSPFDSPFFGSLFSYGQSFYYRGSYYGYNYGGGCYNAGGAGFNPFGYGYGYGGYMAQGPFGPPIGLTLANAAHHRTPLTPRPAHPPILRMPLPSTADQHQARLAAADRPHFNPEYRNRGLLTTDDPAAKPSGRSHREPGLDAHAEGMRTRPAIQEMVNRRMQNQNEGREWSHTQRMTGADGGMIRQGFAQPQSGLGTGRVRSQGEDRSGFARTGGDQPRYHAQDGQRGSPRSDPGTQRLSAPAQPHFSAPAQSHASPASAPARVSAPAPAAPPAASASSASSSKP